MPKSRSSSPKKMGRPTKLTPELQEKIVAAVRRGNYIETAAAIAGVSKVTLYKWLRRGARAKKGAHSDFVNAVEKADGEAEAEDLKVIGEAGKTQWQARAWRLERRRPGKYGRRERIEHTGEGGGPVKFESLLTAASQGKFGRKRVKREGR